MATTFNFKDKVIAVTGGASGIGLALAELLAASGAKVSIADVQETLLQQVATKLEKAGGQVLATVVDVSDSKQVNNWIQKTVDKFGKLDGAANLAGVIPKSINIDRIEELKDEDWVFVMSINLTGVMYCLRSQIPHMKPKGSIVNAASVAGIMGFAKNAAYAASKHGVVGLTRSAAKEVGDRGIRVNCIAPGIIDTPMNRTSTVIRGGEMTMFSAIKRKGEASEAAALVAWLLSDNSQFISGTVQSIDGGWVC